ncbi:MAG: type 4a pilus biogenesis protein PilO [Bacteriovoracaceae bacterium]|nr:type 4a pilus biogenesis protein PilO [Bacteriovoracaceae bacterium]
MGIIIKNIHFLIIALGLFNAYMLWEEKSEMITNLNDQISVLNNSIETKKRNKKELQNFFRDINEAKDRIERVALEIEKAQQQLPADLNDAEVIGFITRKADELNIREINISPEMKDDDKGFYSIRKYNFKAKGTYVQFLILFENISDYKRILNIGKVIFNRNNVQQRSRFQVIDGEIQVWAYRYNTGYKEDRGIEEIDKNLATGGGARGPKGKKAGGDSGED